MSVLEAARVIVLAGLSAGVLDFIGACVTAAPRGITPMRVAHSVASGWIGAKAFEGGYKTAALGVASHFFIAQVVAAIFYLAAQQWRWLVEQPFISGALYGIAVYWFMQLVVLPLSRISFKRSFAPANVATGLIVHVLCVGWPIALVVAWFSQ